MEAACVCLLGRLACCVVSIVFRAQRQPVFPSKLQRGKKEDPGDCARLNLDLVVANVVVVAVAGAGELHPDYADPWRVEVGSALDGGTRLVPPKLLLATSVQLEPSTE